MRSGCARRREPAFRGGLRAASPTRPIWPARRLPAGGEARAWRHRRLAAEVGSVLELPAQEGDLGFALREFFCAGAFGFEANLRLRKF